MMQGMFRKTEEVNRSRAIKKKLIKRFKYGEYKNYDNMMQMIIVDHFKTYDYFQHIAKHS